MSVAPDTVEILTRDQIALEDTWDLSTIFASDDEWEQTAATIPDLIKTAASHRGKLTESPAALRQALDDSLSLGLAMERLQVYAALRRDEDQTNTDAQARYERVVALAIEAGEALAYMDPEILAMPEADLVAAINDPLLADFRHTLDNLLRNRPYVRSTEIEELLAQSGDIARAASDAFSALDNADLTFGTVVDDEGRTVELTKARHGALMESKNRDVRRAAHEGISSAYVAHRHTLAALHGASVRKDVYYAKVRGYPSVRAAALHSDNLPDAVYDGLIEAVREAGPTITRMMELRRRALGVDQLAIYDLRVPLAPVPDRKFTYREGVDVVLEGLRLLGEQYQNDLRAGFNSRWVDVHETKGKRSGAYSWGAYGSPPVMLMNWNGTLNDVFTLAHEAGHAMHSFYSDRAQLYQNAGYPIFLAEVASTVNETLLTWHLLDETAPDDYLTRFDLLNRFADDFMTTIVRQTMFAEFEHRTHTNVEGGVPLTVAVLDDLFAELSEVYYPTVAVDDLVKVHWARIPHFYRAFYVFKYATGLSAAVALAQQIREEGRPAQERYLQFLSAGGSDYPLPILQRAGVDLTTPEPIRSALREFDRVVTELEALEATGILNQASDTAGSNGASPEVD